MNERKMKVKRKINMIKSLMLTIAANSLINWIMWVVSMIGLLCNFDPVFFKIMCLIFWIELMLMDVNTYFYIESEEEKDGQSNTDETVN